MIQTRIETQLEIEYVLLRETEDAIDYWSLIVEDPHTAPGERAAATAHLRFHRQIASRKRTRIAELKRKIGE